MRKTHRQLSSSSSGRAGLVSVIVATRDRPQQLVRLLKSIHRQTYKRMETIVVDDVHDSNVTDLAKRYFVDTLVRTRGVGAAAAFNRGFLSSKGEFVIFSDDDLEWDRKMITKLVQALKAHPLRAYAYCGFRNVEGERECILGLLEFDPERISYGNYISGTSLIRRRKFIEVGMFDSSLKRLIDWDLWLSLLERGEEGVLVPEVLFEHVHLGGPRISDDNNPNSLPYAIAHQQVERKHSAFIQSRRIENLMRENARLASESADLRSRLVMATEQNERLISENNDLRIRLSTAQQQLDKTGKEIEDIRSSFGYRVMRLYASRIDGLCPDGTRRGRVRKRLVARLRT
jgi:glycosyltransferase involved in cell wall biosynthesis